MRNQSRLNCVRNRAGPTTLKHDSCNDVNFVVSSGSGGCRDDNIRCQQWQQSRQYDNTQIDEYITCKHFVSVA